MKKFSERDAVDDHTPNNGFLAGFVLGSIAGILMVGISADPWPVRAMLEVIGMTALLGAVAGYLVVAALRRTRARPDDAPMSDPYDRHDMDGGFEFDD